MDDSSKATKLSPVDLTGINTIWRLLKRPQDLGDDDIWLFVHIKEYQASLVPNAFSDTGHIPNSLINFLEFDSRNDPTFMEHVDHLAFYISGEFIMSTHRFW